MKERICANLYIVAIVFLLFICPGIQCHLLFLLFVYDLLSFSNLFYQEAYFEYPTSLTISQLSFFFIYFFVSCTYIRICNACCTLLSHSSFVPCIQYILYKIFINWLFFNLIVCLIPGAGELLGTCTWAGLGSFRKRRFKWMGRYLQWSSNVWTGTSLIPWTSYQSQIVKLWESYTPCQKGCSWSQWLATLGGNTHF